MRDRCHHRDVDGYRTLRHRHVGPDHAMKQPCLHLWSRRRFGTWLRIGSGLGTADSAASRIYGDVGVHRVVSKGTRTPVGRRVVLMSSTTPLLACDFTQARKK
jgi:hypothetical protein